MKDGLALSLKFARNHGKLKRISEQSGIPIDDLNLFMEEKITFSRQQRKKLHKLEREGLR